MKSLVNIRSAAVALSALAISACGGGAKASPAPAPAIKNGTAQRGPMFSTPLVSASLYKRLGGYDAIAAVTDEFMHRIHGDTAIMIFFAGLDSTAMRRIRQNVVDQLCSATGGPCYYTGKTMKDIHSTLEINDDAFNRFIGHFQATLTAFAVPSREQNEVMGALLSMKGDVVKKQ